MIKKERWMNWCVSVCWGGGLGFWLKGVRTLMPCIRDMARSGLKARSVRIVLNAWMPPAPQSEATKLINDTYENGQNNVKNATSVETKRKKKTKHNTWNETLSHKKNWRDKWPQSHKSHTDFGCSFSVKKEIRTFFFGVCLFRR